MMSASSPRFGPTVAAIAVALPMIAVLIAVLHGATGADAALWAHLREHVLARVVANTAILVAGRGHDCDAARDFAGLADGGLRVSGPRILFLGAAAADGDAGLRARLRCGRDARLRGRRANGLARLVRQRIPRAADPHDRRRDRRARARRLSLCLPHGARRFPDARRARARSRAIARPRSLGRPFPRRRAARAALARRRCGARRHGDARGLRRRVGLQRRHVHDRNLQGLVRPVLDRNGARPCAAAAHLRRGRNRARASRARTRALCRRGRRRAARRAAQAARRARLVRLRIRRDGICARFRAAGRRARALGLERRPDRSRCALPGLHLPDARSRRDGGDRLCRARAHARLRDARCRGRHDPHGCRASRRSAMRFRARCSRSAS